MQSLVHRTALGWSFALILLAAVPVSAAISPEQRKEAETLKADVDKAGRLFQMEKFKEAGEILRDVQARVEKYAETADAQAIKLLDPVMVRLKRAHGLLELEGVELAPIKELEPGVKPPAKPDPKKPATPPAAGGETSFVAEIAPILVTRCGNCHVKEARVRFSMADYATLMKGPAEGVVIFPGEPVGSRLIEVIESGDMPRGGGKVAPAEYALLQKWIKEGAKFDGKDPMANLAALSPDAKAEEPKMLEVVAATGKETVSFAKDVAPVLAGTCYNCHGGGQQTRANFNLVTFNGLLKGGDSASPIVPGKGAESLLIKKLRGTAEGNRMPQNLPALADNVIAKIEKWIDEGAKYDGGDPAMNVRQVAALAKANSSTHEELLAERKVLAGEKWRLALPDIESAEIESKNFLVVGNVSKERLTAVSEAAEAIAPKVGTMLKAPSSLPLIKGRMTLYVFDKLYDYDEFGNMVERRDVPKTMRGHFSASPVEVYGAILPSKEDEYSLEALVGQQIAGAVVANLGKGTPKWFSEGAARAIADKLASDDPRVAVWDAELPRVLASMRSSDAFLTGQLNPEDADIANYSFVRWLMNDSRKFERLLTALRQGQDFTQAFTAVYGGSPAQLTVAWSAKGAITKRGK